MGSWRSRATFAGDPEKVLDLLTDPDQVRAWSPINFEVEDLEADRLQTGAMMHVHGKLAGRRMSFDVEVFKASDGKEYALVANSFAKSFAMSAWISFH